MKMITIVFLWKKYRVLSQVVINAYEMLKNIVKTMIVDSNCMFCNLTKNSICKNISIACNCIIVYIKMFRCLYARLCTPFVVL